MPLGQGTAYRPIRSIFMAISYSLWGKEPFGYHLQSILLHTLIVMLMYLILKRLGFKRVVSFSAALLFGIHPLQVQSVAWISGNYDVIAYLFFFLSIYLYLLSKQHKHQKLQKAAIIFAWLSFFSKEATFILPPLLLLYEFFACTKNRFKWKKVLSSHRYYWFGLLAYIIVSTALMPERSTYSSLVDPYFGSPLMSIILIFWYYRLMFWPNALAINHSLGSGLTSFFREDGTRPISFEKLINIKLAMGSVLLLLGLILTLLLKKKHPMTAFMLTGSLISLLPVLQLPPTNTLFLELYTYLSLFFFCGFIASMLWLIIELVGKRINPLLARSAGLIALAILSMILISKTRTENQVWASEITLWNKVVDTTPNSAKANYNLGLAYYREGDYDTGISYMEKSVDLKPGSYKEAYGLLNAYLEQKRDQKLLDLTDTILIKSQERVGTCAGIKQLLMRYERNDLINKLNDCSKQ